MRSEEIRSKILQKQALRGKYETELKEHSSNLKSLLKDQLKYTDIVKLLSHCLLEFGKTTQFLSEFVTESMNSVYPNNTFKIDFPFTYDSASNPNGLWYTVTKNGVVLEDPKDDLGDGEYSYLVLFIFLGCFLKSTKEGNRVLYLDEPIPAVDLSSWKALGQVLLEVCKEFNCQINMTTHVTVPMGKTFVMSNGKVKEILNDTFDQ